MSEDTTTFLILVGGLLVLFKGLAPIVSRKYFDQVNKDLWEDNNPAWTKRGSYLYNRYYRQINFLIVGPILVGYAIYRMFFE